MKGTIWVMTGLTLAGGIAAAQEETQDYDRDKSIIIESEREDRSGIDDPTDRGDYDTQAQTEPDDTGTQADNGTIVSEMSAAELVGRPVILEDGGLVGTIQEVGYSEMHDARIATVDISGFVGAADKLIAIPLDDLRADREDNLVTTQSREWIETEDPFDPSDLHVDP